VPAESKKKLSIQLLISLAQKQQQVKKIKNTLALFRNKKTLAYRDAVRQGLQIGHRRSPSAQTSGPKGHPNLR
jgi:hypothetical protein